jgi:uncharacterized protein (TIGR02145 family)
VKNPRIMSNFKFPDKLVSGFLLISLVVSCESRFPSVRTIDVINITTNSAQSGGIVTDEGSGTVIARGLVWSLDHIPTLESHDGFTSEGTGLGIFNSTMNDLSPSTEYKVRAYASNKAGDSYGMLYYFTTLPVNAAAPEIITTTPEAVATDSAQLGGKILSDNGLEIIEKGVYWGISRNPESTGIKMKAGSGPERYTVTITGLIPNITYYVRAYVKNSSGEYLGMQVSFTTCLFLSGEISFNNSISYGSVSDIEGNVYKTVKIGSQTWMAENLRTTKYNDGLPIDNVTNKSIWTALVTPAYCWYNNLIENKNLIGAHYNWYAVNTSRLCPTGWHVPSDYEWTILTDYLGGLEIAGAKMKEAGFAHWEEPNVGAKNSSGFTAIPAGQRRGIEGTFTGIGLYDSWWSSTEYNFYKSWYRSVATINTNVWRSSGTLKQTGTSIRCIKY